VDIIATHAPALAPAPFNIVTETLGSHLLTMAIDAAVGPVDFSTPGRRPKGCFRIVPVGLLYMHFGQAPILQVGSENQAAPGRSQGEKSPGEDGRTVVHRRFHGARVKGPDGRSVTRPAWIKDTGG